MQENYFLRLYEIDVSDEVMKKNGLPYLPWAAAIRWVKELFPDATYTIYEWAPERPFEEETITFDEEGRKKTYHKISRPITPRFWYDDGRSGWVKVGVTICGVEHIEDYPILDLKNNPIPADKITSANANKAVKRALTKCCADHGLGMYLYKSEELKEDGTRKTSDEKALEKERNAVLKLCKEKAAAGVDRTKMYDIIKDVAGNKNPNSIPNAAKCKEVIRRINELK